jgi:hypothetical protein
LFYYIFIYFFLKAIETIFEKESILSFLWNKILDTFGDNEGFHIVWGVNIYAFFFYWIFGGLLVVLQKTKIPKSLINYKIQEKKFEIEDIEILVKVSFDC